MTDQPAVAFVEKDGAKLAYRLRKGASPTLVFLPGYASDMDGSKAVALDGLAERLVLGMLRFDYSGTGCSDGKFEDGTLERWLDEALLLIDRLTDGPLVVIGSSMGGWIALHVALRRPHRVRALVGIAAAPDFTEWGYSDEEKLKLVAEGRIEQDNPYGGEPQLTTRGFWESGETLRLLHEDIAIDCPVRLIHGDSDEEVPIDVASRLMARLHSADVQLLVVKGGGHRLSRDHEIDAILHTVELQVEPIR